MDMSLHHNSLLQNDRKIISVYTSDVWDIHCCFFLAVCQFAFIYIVPHKMQHISCRTAKDEGGIGVLSLRLKNRCWSPYVRIHYALPHYCVRNLFSLYRHLGEIDIYWQRFVEVLVDNFSCLGNASFKIEFRKFLLAINTQPI